MSVQICSTFTRDSRYTNNWGVDFFVYNEFSAFGSRWEYIGRVGWYEQIPGYRENYPYIITTSCLVPNTPQFPQCHVSSLRMAAEWFEAYAPVAVTAWEREAEALEWAAKVEVEQAAARVELLPE
jgi:hypothetical protein